MAVYRALRYRRRSGDVDEVVLDLLGREPLEAVGVAHAEIHD